MSCADCRELVERGRPIQFGIADVLWVTAGIAIAIWLHQSIRGIHLGPMVTWLLMTVAWRAARSNQPAWHVWSNVTGTMVLASLLCVGGLINSFSWIGGPPSAYDMSKTFILEYVRAFTFVLATSPAVLWFLANNSGTSDNRTVRSLRWAALLAWFDATAVVCSLIVLLELSGLWAVR